MAYRTGMHLPPQPSVSAVPARPAVSDRRPTAVRRRSDVANYDSHVSRAALVAALAAVVHGGSFPHSLSVTLSNNRVGARPIVMTLALQTELQCGHLFGGTLVVRLPAGERVPKAIPAKAVLISGLPSRGVSVSGHELTVQVPRPTGVMCAVLGPGTAKIVLTRAAGLGNPARAGSYRVSLTRAGDQLQARFTIR